MACWLLKSEPDEFSLADLEHLGQARWDGVRNYQARNFLRAMAPDELFFFHHSSCAEPGIAGIGRIVGAAFADPTALDPESPYHAPRASAENNPWTARQVAFVEAFPRVLTLPRLRQLPELADFALLRKGNRLSVMPVSPAEWTAIVAAARG
ncbi:MULTISPECIES: EVE domain-containing protein [unclassified Pseudomonas]|uniref:EVE domain-containing protein n=1 Tax=unclassified Pseudomonas TaxID=196821 RepID=UPI0023620698|nr:MULTISPECIES: EVE domain-containing protein [unclassified Pseudomonas]MDR6180346.1 putative RNA-binding protein with PUA-like domain [Pseudomonas sp. SORGH_AS_0211]